MTFPRPQRSEAGFTLVEVLIALVIMSIVSVAILGSITTLSGSSQQFRGSADVDAAASTYVEAVQSHVSFTTTLTAALSACSAPCTSSVSVADSSQLSTAAAPLEIVVGGELMKIPQGQGGQSGPTTFTNVVRGDRGTTAAEHDVGAPVNAVYTPCPMVAQLQPVGPPSPPSGVAVQITNLEYWNPPTGTFTPDRATCLAYFELFCPDYHNDHNNWSQTFQDGNLPECDPGLERLTVTATGDATTGHSSTVTATMVRRGEG